MTYAAVTKDELRDFLNEVFGDVVPTGRKEAIDYVRDEFGAVEMRVVLEVIKEKYGL